MSNVHRLGDYENNNNNRRGGAGGFGNAQENIQQYISQLQALNIPFMNLEQETIPPRKETFWDMLKINFCPRLKLFSFSTLLLVTILTMFIITSSQGISREPNSSLLQQNRDVLIRFGANFAYNIKHELEVWRLITAAYLHIEFMHIVFNALTIMIIVSSFERTYGFFMTFFMWIITCIGGNIFSANFANAESVSAGASTGILGMMGLFIAFIILNWKALEQLQQVRCMLLCIAFVFILMMLMLGGVQSTTSKSSASVDNLGHIGGFISGVLVGVAVPKSIKPPGDYEKKAKMIFSFLSLLYFILCFVLFFTVTTF